MLAAGTMLNDRYRVERPLARGGMGSVYLAVDTTFGSKVAVKHMEAVDETLRSAFRREAKILNRLRHAAIPVVFDYFADGSGDYLVMQYIEGEDLGMLTDRRPMPFPVDVVLDWGDQLLDALEYLHGNKPPVIHRDIKPRNLKLSPEREVILLDFGLSKLAGDDSSISNAGMSLPWASKSYSPVEQMLRLGTTARSDLYSLGATLYFLMTKEKLPPSVQRGSRTARGQGDPLKAPSAVVPAIAPEISDALLRALAIAPEDRYATATEMREALSAARRAAAQDAGRGV
jgi:serine/threonine protein kinase